MAIEPITKDAVPARLAEALLPIEGMTCASCVRRVEKSLAKLPGVETVAVNLATEQATVTYNPAMVGRGEFGQAVEKAGYGIREVDLTSASSATGQDTQVDHEAQRRARDLATLRARFLTSLVAGLIIMVGMFLPMSVLPISMHDRYVAMFFLATPVQLWAGWGFYK